MKLHTLIGEISRGAYAVALIVQDHGTIEIATLSQFIDRNDRTIRRYLSELESAGLIQRDRNKVKFTPRLDKRRPDLPQVWEDYFEQYGIFVPAMKKAKADKLSLAFRKTSPSVLDWDKVRGADWPISLLASNTSPHGVISSELILSRGIGRAEKENTENAPQIKDSDKSAILDKLKRIKK